MPQRKHRAWIALIIPLAIFTILRLPAILHQPGGQDEQLFAVPGYMVWQEGIPRIPFYPARTRSTMFEKSDQCLMAMPPALFYCQAPFHAIFPPGYPTARLPAFIAALIAIVLIYVLAKSFGSNALWAFVMACLFAISRPLMFTGTLARPDLLCVVCGLGAILFWIRSESRDPSYRWLLIGGLCGLACLCHPLGIVFCMQAGLAAILSFGSNRVRFVRAAVLVASVAVVLALWLPLIVQYPEEFRTQFFANIFDRAGPGLPSRLVWPIPSFIHHSRLIWEFAGPWQCLFFGIVVGSGIIKWFRSERSGKSTRVGQPLISPLNPLSANGVPTDDALGTVKPCNQLWKLLAIVLSSIYLTASAAGIHPMQTYWVYSSALIFVFAAVCASMYLTTPLACRITIAMLILLMLPGAGLRTAWIFLRHWGEPEYHARSFIQNVLKEYPHEGLYLSDSSYVFDIYLSGRKTVLLRDRTDYAGRIELDCDFIFSAWEGNDAGWADQYGPYAVRKLGQRVPKQACYVDILVPTKSP